MNEVKNIHPPQWPLRLLRFFVKKKYLEEIEGDMEEIFYDNVERFSLRKARRVYAVEMLKLLRPNLVRNFEFINQLIQFSMFQNYFKVSMRGLLKNPLSSFINVFGLALAIGVCMLGYGFARWTYSTDQFHEHKNEVFLTTFFTTHDGVEQQYGRTPRPLGELMRQDFAHVKKVCRVEDRHVVVKYGDNVYMERVRYTDPEFLDMFTFPLKWGEARSLKDINSIILSEEMSEKYFGEANPVGKTITVKFDTDHGKEFKVTGVAEKFPLSRTITFGFLVNFENLRVAEPTYDVHDWRALVNATLIMVDKPENISSVASGMEKYKKLQNLAVSEDWQISSFGFEPLATLHERSENIKEDISRSSQNNLKSIVFMAIIGVFILALACINYINIAIVSATRRLKEIAVRKSIGASRKVVMIQFLSENVLITSFALVVGLFIGAFGVIPWFEGMNDFDMGFRFDDPNLWIFLPLILLVTGIASGAYPAFYISKFQVAGILKGSMKFGTKNPMTKIFLGFQLALACVFISMGVMFTQNSNYLAKRPWGYDQAEAMYAVIPDEFAFEQFSVLMSGNPDVVAVSGSVNHIAKSHVSTVIHMPDRELEVDQLSVDPRYFETMGIQLKEGRLFNDHEGSDRQAVIVNETLVKNLKWEQPLKQVFDIDSTQYEVVGVVKDFHNYNFSQVVRPLIFRVGNKKDFKYLTLKVREGAEIETYKDMQDKWAGLYPDIPFTGGFQEDAWGSYLEFLQVHGKVWRFMAGVAVILATLGLYGLMTLNIAGRVREFSIRKVLGAGLASMSGLITKQYIWLFGIALLVGAPVSYFLSNFVLDLAYKYHIPPGYSGAVVAIILLLLVLVVTVATQVRKVMMDNAVEGLKVE
ncbi:MAG TPA: ABC transporter permease [Cyclobacteriaceae bacterium]|nr:ABC transporter permease [Cyclobacteriaceae bacterium]